MYTFAIHGLLRFTILGCGHCKKLDPKYQQLATTFKSDKNVAVAQINCQEYQDQAQKYGISAYPTIKLFSKQAEPVSYQGPHEVEALVQFLNQQTGSKRKLDGDLTEDAGIIPAFDEILKKFFEKSDSAGSAALKAAQSKAAELNDL